MSRSQPASPSVYAASRVSRSAAQVGRVGGVVVGVGRVDVGQSVGDGVAEVGHPQRVLPEVRVHVAVVVLLLALLVCVLLVLVVALLGVLQVHHVGHVDDLALGVLLDPGVDRRLEPVLVDDEVGGGDLRGLPDRQLEVVRLLARLGEVGDLGVVAGDPLRGVLQGIEGRGDLDAVLGRAGVVAERGAAGGDQEQESEQGESHENDSQPR